MPINKLRDMSEALLVKAKLKEAEDTKAADDAADAAAKSVTTSADAAAKSAKTAEDAEAKDAGDEASKHGARAVAVAGTAAIAEDAPSAGTSAMPNELPYSPVGALAADREVIALLTEIRDQLAKQSAA